MSRLLSPVDCVMDVGANVGHFSAVFARFVGWGGFVHAFEADPDLFLRLQQLMSDVSVTRSERITWRYGIPVALSQFILPPILVGRPRCRMIRLRLQVFLRYPPSRLTSLCKEKVSCMCACSDWI